jgi:exo-beta-1,3-glucanase (GH17 family)
MKNQIKFIVFIVFLTICYSCINKTSESDSTKDNEKTLLNAGDILGNPEYQAISYGGYREITRDTQPSIDQLKEDLKILAAMQIKFVRTYNTHFPQASNILEAIHQLKMEDPDYEMYVMLGAWIDCENAFKASPNHDNEDIKANTSEIQRAVDLANKYKDIVKVIAVGNEAMVKWAASYFVQPAVILKWVNHLQELKNTGELPKDLWITSSDNFASWGGGGEEYHVEDLEKLIKAVDYVSLHTYPMHDTHYNPQFWGITESEDELTAIEKIDMAMDRAKEYAISQYQNTSNYISSLGIEKPIHIGETGWASFSNGQYGNEGSKATDEYKEAIYYAQIREWTNQNNISCFYFEAFDEIWKDASNPGGSENHFGLFTIDGQAKFALWDLVDKGSFKGLTRDGKPITKTYNGDKERLLEDVEMPPVMSLELVE